MDTCTKEQAIEACSKYAQACGYGSDCDITVYAFTLDAIEKVNKVFYDSISAPGEGFDIVTKGQVEELRDEGKDEEAEKWIINYIAQLGADCHGKKSMKQWYCIIVLRSMDF